MSAAKVNALRALEEAVAESGWSVEESFGWLAILNADGGFVAGVRDGTRLLTEDPINIDTELMALLLEASR